MSPEHLGCDAVPQTDLGHWPGRDSAGATAHDHRQRLHPGGVSLPGGAHRAGVDAGWGGVSACGEADGAIAAPERSAIPIARQGMASPMMAWSTISAHCSSSLLK